MIDIWPWAKPGWRTVPHVLLNHHRYHESLGDLTPADVYLVRAKIILRPRKEIKAKTIEKRRLLHRQTAA